jgi:CheY-like chemotaxis protein
MPRILVVDDEHDFLSLSKSMLKKQGFEVYTTAGAENLSLIIETFDPKLIILDIKLDIHDGREICRQLKNQPGTKDIKIILHSAHVDCAKDYHLYGAEDFISKPYLMNHLVKKIQIHLPAKAC